METKENGMLKIQFKNGDIKRFEYSRFKDTHTLSGIFSEMTKSGLLVLELKDRMLCFPLHNIQTLEILPSPPKLPLWAIKNAREIKN